MGEEDAAGPFELSCLTEMEIKWSCVIRRTNIQPLSASELTDSVFVVLSVDSQSLQQ